MINKKLFIKAVAGIAAAIMCFSIINYGIESVILADPGATVENVNPWESGGQITLNLKDCEGYSKITVKVDFGGSVTDASGWGFDSYKVEGSVVTAEVSKDGPNAWAFGGSVGIQVNGSDIKDIKLLSVKGDGKDIASPDQGKDKPKDNEPQKPDPKKPDPKDQPKPAESKKGKKGDDWLTTSGSRIVDKDGREVWLTGVNWFGYNTGTNIFDGCWSCNMESALRAIADRGFNLLRIPISAELLLNWKEGNYPQANFNQAENPDLVGLNSLQIFDKVLEICESCGIKVMIDIHSAETDASGHNAPLWYTGKISADQYIEALDFISGRYKDNDTIVAYDLKNEPHGAGNEQVRAIWNDSKNENNWKYIAEKAGNTVLNNNPHALIVIEGNQIFPKDPDSNDYTSMNEGDYHNTWWGGNLMGVKKYPVDLGSAEKNRQIVYSPHDYGPAVYEQPWFKGGFDYDSLKRDCWDRYWLYIKDQDIAPILIGEWGGFMSGDNLTWMKYIRQLINEKKLHYTFWCFNANSGDTGGLVLDDFKTWDEEKYAFVSEVLWKNKDGKSIGLDHEVPLGSDGVSIASVDGAKPPKDKDPKEKDPKDKGPEDEQKPEQTEPSKKAPAETTGVTEASRETSETKASEKASETSAATKETTSETTVSESVTTTSDTETETTTLDNEVENYEEHAKLSDEELLAGLHDDKEERKRPEPVKLTGVLDALKIIGIVLVSIVAILFAIIVVRFVLKKKK